MGSVIGVGVGEAGSVAPLGVSASSVEDSRSTTGELAMGGVAGAAAAEGAGSCAGAIACGACCASVPAARGLRAEGSSRRAAAC